MAIINGNLNDSIIADAAIEAFTGEIAALRAFSTDFSAATAQTGAIIQVAIPANITAGTSQNAYEAEDTSVLNAASVPLNRYAKATVGITDLEFSYSSYARLEKFAIQQGKAVARKIIADAWETINSSTYPQRVIKALASLGSADVRALRVLLSKANVPLMDRSIFLNVDAFDRIMGDTTITLSNAMAYGGSEVVREGIIPRFLGFDVIESNMVPGFENLIGFAVHPSAMAIAIRTLLPQAPGEYLESRVITDEKTGIGLGYRRHYSAGKGTHYCTFEALYGFSAAVPSGLARLVTA